MASWCCARFEPREGARRRVRNSARDGNATYRVSPSRVVTSRPSSRGLFCSSSQAKNSTSASETLSLPREPRGLDWPRDDRRSRRAQQGLRLREAAPVETHRPTHLCEARLRARPRRRGSRCLSGQAVAGQAALVDQPAGRTLGDGHEFGRLARIQAASLTGAEAFITYCRLSIRGLTRAYARRHGAAEAGPEPGS